MNKRTLELYKLAHVPHTDIDPSNNMPYETTIFSAEKFTQLIVNECIEVLESRYTSDKELEGYGEVVYLLQQSIEEHFGVE